MVRGFYILKIFKYKLISTFLNENTWKEETSCKKFQIYFLLSHLGMKNKIQNVITEK